MKHEEIMSGELLVIGKDSIQIALRRGRIETVLVEFKDHQIAMTPCNPHHDKLIWEIHDRHHGIVLEVKWDVSSPRAVLWAVSFIA